MKRHSLLGICFILGFSGSAFEIAEYATAGESLPDASLVAYRIRHAPKPPQPKISEVTLTGTITDVQPDGLTIKASKTNKSKNQKQWFVLAQSDTTDFTIHGMATPDYLRKGHVIEFSAEIISTEKTADTPKEEKTADSVKELTIIARKGGLAAKKGGAKERDHAIQPGIGGRIEVPKPESDTETFSEDSAGSAKPATVKGDSPAATVEASGHKAQITARIASINERNLTVTCGERTIHAELSEIPTIYVEVSSPKVVADSKDKTKVKLEGPGASGRLVTITGSDLIGAKIVVHGTAAETKSKRQCAAKSIDVTLASPLTGKKSP